MPERVLDGRKARGIIALLLSLARLAECAALRSFPVRWLVLVLLRRAEAAALTLLPVAAPIDRASLDDPDAGFRPADALLLAAHLRTIAALLSAVLAVSAFAHSRSLARGSAQCAVRPRLHPAIASSANLPNGAFDTS